MCMILGFLDVSMTLKNQLFLSLETPTNIPKIIQGKTHVFIKKTSVGNLKIWETEHFFFFDKTGAEQS